MQVDRAGVDRGVRRAGVDRAEQPAGAASTTATGPPPGAAHVDRPAGRSRVDGQYQPGGPAAQHPVRDQLVEQRRLGRGAAEQLQVGRR